MKTCNDCMVEKPLDEYPKISKNHLRPKCKECTRKYNREHYGKNKDKAKIRNDKYRKNNQEKIKLLQESWKKKNPEKVKISRKKSEKLHVDKNKERTRRYRLDNPEKTIRYSVISDLSKQLHTTREEILKYPELIRLQTTQILIKRKIR